MPVYIGARTVLPSTCADRATTGHVLCRVNFAIATTLLEPNARLHPPSTHFQAGVVMADPNIVEHLGAAADDLLGHVS